MINPKLHQYVDRLTPDQDYLVREFVEYYEDGGLRRRDLLERVLHIAGSASAAAGLLLALGVKPAHADKQSVSQPAMLPRYSHVHGEWVCEVWQAAYGHKARKRTWLFYVGDRPAELDWHRPVGTHWIGNCDSRDKGRNKPTVTKKEASATPPSFRDALLDLARSAVPIARAA